VLLDLINQTVDGAAADGLFAALIDREQGHAARPIPIPSVAPPSPKPLPSPPSSPIPAATAGAGGAP
jgi:hypothetical protein